MTNNSSDKVSITPRMLRIEGAAQYTGVTNWFMEELLRRDKIPFSWVGKHKVVDREDLDKWIVEYKKTQFYNQATRRWRKEHPGESEPRLIMTDEQAQAFFDGVAKAADGNLQCDPNDDD